QRLEPGSADRVAAICASPTFSWPTLAAAAKHHAVAPLVLTRILEIDAVAGRIPCATLEHWKQEKIRVLLRKKKQAADVRRMIAYFTGRGRRVMLVKGSAIDAVVYAEPWYVRS